MAAAGWAGRLPHRRGFRPLRWLLWWWRSSLTVRVATMTLVLSSAAAVLVGVTILHQVAGGLLSAARRGALAQLDAGRSFARQQFEAVPPGDEGAVNRTAYNVVGQLASPGGPSAHGVFLISRSAGSRSPFLPGGWSKNTVPLALRHEVDSENRVAWQPMLLRRPGVAPVPALAVGAPVVTGAAAYDLYLVFPLGQQAQTLALVQRTVLLSGVVLVGLLVILTALVTRQVVRPVRAAAVIAERLAGGRHQERMPVHGHDELASLARSFNRMAEQVQHQISQLQELSRVQQRFVADVSHELRTPLTTVRMAADVLHDGRDDLPPDLARAAELLQTQLDRFESLLADLLEISRHDAKAAVLEAEPVDLVALVTGVLDTLEPLALRRHVRMQADLPAEPVVVEADPRRVQRVLRNLVTNAIEHGAGKPVQVQVGVGAEGVAVVVRDHGPGLRPGEAPLVFGRFWRADPARARHTGGTGLGLSIALEDARLHGGWLQAWGEPGVGAAFRLTLPWRAGEPLHGSPLPLPPQPDPSAREAARG